MEAVFAGQSYDAISNSTRADGTLPPGVDNVPGFGIGPFPEPTATRKSCFIVLDIAHEDEWVFALPTGAWSRILMNIFANAMKYTDSGYIIVSLRNGVRTSTGAAQITLTITDSGRGINPQFLANKIFQPFSQENPHAPGTGLGLSIVRQILETLGGKVEVMSEMNIGTKFSVKLAMPKTDDAQVDLPKRTQFRAILPRLAGRRICILHKEHPMASETSPQNYKGLKAFTDALAATLKNWLKMDVIQTTEWEGNNCDLVICPETSFEYLGAIRRRRLKGKKAPVTVFVAMDGLEAATLREDARVLSKESVVEVMIQP